MSVNVSFTLVTFKFSQVAVDMMFTVSYAQSKQKFSIKLSNNATQLSS